MRKQVSISLLCYYNINVSAHTESQFLRDKQVQPLLKGSQLNLRLDAVMKRNTDANNALHCALRAGNKTQLISKISAYFFFFKFCTFYEQDCLHCWNVCDVLNKVSLPRQVLTQFLILHWNPDCQPHYSDPPLSQCWFRFKVMVIISLYSCIPRGYSLPLLVCHFCLD